MLCFQPNSDIVLGYFDGEGKAVIRDMFTPGYIPPTPDANQDISQASLKREDGVNVLKFRKKISSGADESWRFTLGGDENLEIHSDRAKK